jgi:hypothetical protein
MPNGCELMFWRFDILLIIYLLFLIRRKADLVFDTWPEPGVILLSVPGPESGVILFFVTWPEPGPPVLSCAILIFHFLH